MSVQNKVEEIIEDFVAKGWPFTALDVSNAVKSDISDPVRHRDIAPIVRSLYAAGSLFQHGYERELIDVTLSDGNKRQAYLYHHWSVDTNAYTNRCQEPIVPASFKTDDSSPDAGQLNIGNVVVTSKAVPTPSSVTATPVVQNQLKRSQKNDHRLEVPASWVGEVGLSGTVYAVRDNPKLVLKNANDVDANDDIVGMMWVNADGRLRVTKKVLDRMFTSSASGNELLVSKNQDSIVVEED
jgi:hypothetical protein